MSTNESVREKPWFYFEEPTIDGDIETFFTKYASIPVSALRDHLITVRERAWQKHKYPCLGQWGFLHCSIKTEPNLSRDS